MTVSRSLFTNLSWSVVGTAVELLSTVTTIVILSRLLEPRAFGVVSLAVAIATMIASVTTISMAQALIIPPKLSSSEIRGTFAISAWLTLVLAFGLALIADALALLFDMPDLTDPLRVLALLIPLRGLSSTAEALMQRDMRFRELSGIQSLAAFVGYGLAGTGCALLGLGLWALVLGQLAHATIKATALLVKCHHPKDWRLHLTVTRALRRMGGGLSIGTLANMIAVQADNFIIAFASGPVALGLYTRAYRVMALPANLFSDAVSVVMFPALAASKEGGAKSYVRSGLTRGTAVMALTVLPISAATFVLAEEVLYVLLGPGWTGAVGAFRVLAIGLFFRVGYKLGGSVLKSQGDVAVLARILSVYAAAVVLGAAIGNHWGILGVSVGVVLALAVTYSLVTIVAAQRTEVRFGTLAYQLAIGCGEAVTIVLLLGWIAERQREYGVPPVAMLGSGALLTAMVIALPVCLPAGAYLGQDINWWIQRVRASIRKVWRGRWRRGFGAR